MATEDGANIKTNSAMAHTERIIAKYVNQWLRQTSSGPTETLWVVAEGREEGMNIAHRMCKEYLGMRQFDIPYDNLPVCTGVNPESRRAAWVLSQPNHVPTIQVSMQGVVGDVIEREAGEDEQRIIEAAAGKKLPHISDNPAGIYADKDRRRFKPDAPAEMLVHQEWPMWDELLQFITSDTKVRMTDKVKQGPPTEADEDPERTLEKYDPGSE